MLICGLVWPVSTLPNIEAVAPSINGYQPLDLKVSRNDEIIEAVPAMAGTHTPVTPDGPGIASTPGGKAPEMGPREDDSRDLKDILSKYYDGTEVFIEERAFKRVISWKEDFENIAERYPNVNWKILSSIIKAETQGKTGRQESLAKAVGITQIKYQGAWAFVWDALFRYEIKSGYGYVKDYYNANLRKRYKSQLQQIYQYLEKNEILEKPKDRSEEGYVNAKSASWSNLKAHLGKKYKPGEYQVAVDIAAMYIDHLIITSQRVKQQVVEIKEYVENNQFEGFDTISFPGVLGTRWDRIKSKLLNQKGKPNFRERTLGRLNHMLNSLEDLSFNYGAYNLGISKCLDYLESGMHLPENISRYIKKVSGYHTIFNEMDMYEIFT